MKSQLIILSVLTCFLVSCEATNFSIDRPTEITRLSYIDEVIIPQGLTFNDTEVGGLSSIDYANGSWYVLSDDRKSPRYYSIDISYGLNGFEAPQILKVISLKNNSNLTFESGKADPESLRAAKNGNLWWSSEGNISTGVHPHIYKVSNDGSFVSEIKLPIRYLAGQSGGNGPRNNGVFEALSIDFNSDNLWVATELPLLQDGESPTSTTAQSPVRIAFINTSNNTFNEEYAYMLDKVARTGQREVNGMTEILSYDKNQFLVLERSYASGYDDGGNNVKIYKVDISNATDVSNINSLSERDFTPAVKTLLFDFETIREQLPSGLVDNIEGMTIGPALENGNRSLIVVSDNNFNSFGQQVTQLILFEVE